MTRLSAQRHTLLRTVEAYSAVKRWQRILQRCAIKGGTYLKRLGLPGRGMADTPACMISVSSMQKAVSAAYSTHRMANQRPYRHDARYDGKSLMLETANCSGSVYITGSCKGSGSPSS